LSSRRFRREHLPPQPNMRRTLRATLSRDAGRRTFRPLPCCTPLYTPTLRPLTRSLATHAHTRPLLDNAAHWRTRFCSPACTTFSRFSRCAPLHILQCPCPFLQIFSLAAVNGPGPCGRQRHTLPPGLPAGGFTARTAACGGQHCSSLPCMLHPTHISGGRREGGGLLPPSSHSCLLPADNNLMLLMPCHASTTHMPLLSSCASRTFVCLAGAHTLCLPASAPCLLHHSILSTIDMLVLPA